MTLFHWVGDAIRYQLERVPLSVAHWMFIGLYLILMFWVVQLPSSTTNPTDHQGSWFADLKVWAWLALITQIVIYSLF